MKELPSSKHPILRHSPRGRRSGPQDCGLFWFMGSIGIQSGRPPPASPVVGMSTIKQFPNSPVPRFHRYTNTRCLAPLDMTEGEVLRRFHNWTIRRFHDSTVPQIQDACPPGVAEQLCPVRLRRHGGGSRFARHDSRGSTSPIPKRWTLIGTIIPEPFQLFTEIGGSFYEYSPVFGIAICNGLLFRFRVNIQVLHDIEQSP
jgi:hypothetical protein